MNVMYCCVGILLIFIRLMLSAASDKLTGLLSLQASIFIMACARQ